MSLVLLDEQLVCVLSRVHFGAAVLQWLLGVLEAFCDFQKAANV